MGNGFHVGFGFVVDRSADLSIGAAKLVFAPLTKLAQIK